MKKNSIWIIIVIGLILVFSRRYTYLSTDIVSFPDSVITFGTQDEYLEQTWQPEVKLIKGIQMPYYAENDFVSDVQLKVFSDDYSEVVVESILANYSFIGGQNGVVEFQFDKTRVIQGERYRIQISLINASKEGILKINSGSNYGGCNVGGEETKSAVDLTITFAKFSKLFWIVAVLFPLCTFSLFLMVFFGRKFEEVVAISMCMEGLVLFIFGMMEHLVLGLNLVYVLAIVLFVVSIVLFNKKGIELIELFSPGLLIYFVFFIFIVLTSHGDWIGARDDMRHWGATVYDMFYYDSLAKHVDTTVILPRYFPFAALIEYAFVYMNGLFNEGILLIAFQTMVLSGLIIVCKPFQRIKDVKKLFPILVMMICVPVVFFNEISSILMVDPIQMALMVYILICYYTEKSKFNNMRIIISLIALTAIKDIGLIFSGMMALIMFGDVIIKQIQERRLLIKELCYPIVCVGVVLATYMSWQVYMSIPIRNTNEIQKIEISEENGAEKNEEKNESTGISASGISVQNLVNVLSGNGAKYQYETAQNFVIALLEEEMYSVSGMKISFMDILMFVAFFIVSLGYFGYWGDKKVMLYTFAGMEIISGVILSVFLLITYWFTFPDYEAVILAGLSRYLAPYLCTIIIVLFYFGFEYLRIDRVERNKIKYIMVVLATLIVINMPIKGLLIEKHEEPKNTVDEITYGHSEITKILRSVGKKGEKVQFLCSGSDGYSDYVFRNSVCPLISEHSWWFIVGTKDIILEQQKQAEINEESYNAEIVSAEMLKERLEDYQYVVVFHADDGFVQSYSEIFGGAENIVDGSVYEIVEEKGDISIELIGTTGIKSWR